MTDDPTNPRDRRINLSALDAGADDTRREAVIRAALDRITAAPRPASDDITRLLRLRRQLLVAAAVLAAFAAASVLARPRRAPEGEVDPISSWAQSSHVPTNGELLAVFQGYAP